jgi:SMI1 / KNR4 family (SUKH-1)
MEIKYLSKLKKNKKIGSETIRGVSETLINQVEDKLKINFPVAYEEFLWLAGEYSGALPLMDTADIETIASDWHQEIMLEEMKSTGTVIEKPFWLFAESNGCEVFLFFYLAENTEDPDVYYTAYALEDGKRDIKPYGASFSQYISDAVDDALKFEKEGN